MNNDNSFKIISICALLIGVVGLTLGFAAYTSSLTIKSSASVTPENTTLDISIAPKTGTGTTVTPTTNGDGVTGNPATIDNSEPDAPVIKNLKANFTKPGQSVTYDFKAKGSASYIAYLRSIQFGSKNCTKAEGSQVSETLMNSACQNISVSVKAGSETFTTTNTAITGHEIAKNGSEDIQVTISYTGDVVVDGAFDVSFGDIVLTYKTAPSA